MKTVDLRRYSEPDALREISPQTQVALTDEHWGFLATKGVELRPVGEKSELNDESLPAIFLSPNDLPRELGGHMVRQMSGPATMESRPQNVRDVTITNARRVPK